MPNQFLSSFCSDSFHINNDLAPLIYMIKTMSLKLSESARQRLAWMDSYRNCGNATQVCQHFSIPKRTFWRWHKRYDPWDLKSLENKSRRPHHSPHKTINLIEHRILAIKTEHPRWGKEKIALFIAKERISISGKTVWKILKRHERIVKYHTRKRKAPKPRVDWLKIRVPGDLLQLDTKHISFGGRTVYQYTIVDVVSRVRYIAIHHQATMYATIVFLHEALPSFGRTILTIQTDNGSEFGQSVTKWLREHHIHHVFSHKKRPTENAYVERSHRTDEEEFYSMGNLGGTVEELRTNLAKYLNMYNTERPHWGLGGKTPAEVLASYSLPKVCHMS